MDASEHISLDCGIAYARIESWLETELPTTVATGEDGSWIFEASGETCRIRIEPLQPRTYGPIALERTLLTVDGAKPAVDEFQRLFTLRFCSAGG